MFGKVANLRMDKGFGFINPTGETDSYFFHKSACQDVSFEDLRIGTKVTFEPTNGPKGLRAENVELTL